MRMYWTEGSKIHLYQLAQSWIPLRCLLESTHHRQHRLSRPRDRDSSPSGGDCIDAYAVVVQLEVHSQVRGDSLARKSSTSLGRPHHQFKGNTKLYTSMKLLYSRWRRNSTCSTKKECYDSCKRHGWPSNWRSSVILANQLTILSNFTSPGKLQLVLMTTEATEKLQYPTFISELRLFLSLCNIFNWFAPEFARFASPRNKYLKKGEPPRFEVDDKDRNALPVIKKMLIIPPMFVISWLDGQQKIGTDD